jgi:hypothetical protein
LREKKSPESEKKSPKIFDKEQKNDTTPIKILQ